MKPLTKEEREFIYAIMNQVAVQGIDANQLKVDVMRKMDVELKSEKALITAVRPHKEEE